MGAFSLEAIGLLCSANAACAALPISFKWLLGSNIKAMAWGLTPGIPAFGVPMRPDAALVGPEAPPITASALNA